MAKRLRISPAVQAPGDLHVVLVVNAGTGARSPTISSAWLAQRFPR